MFKYEDPISFLNSKELTEYNILKSELTKLPDLPQTQEFIVQVLFCRAEKTAAAGLDHVKRYRDSLTSLNIKSVRMADVHDYYSSEFVCRAGTSYSQAALIWVRCNRFRGSNFDAPLAVKNTWCCQDYCLREHCKTISDFAKSCKAGLIFVYDCFDVRISNLTFNPVKLCALLKGVYSHLSVVNKVVIMDAKTLFHRLLSITVPALPADEFKKLAFTELRPLIKTNSISKLELSPNAKILTSLAGLKYLKGTCSLKSCLINENLEDQDFISPGQCSENERTNSIKNCENTKQLEDDSHSMRSSHSSKLKTKLNLKEGSRLVDRNKYQDNNEKSYKNLLCISGSQAINKLNLKQFRRNFSQESGKSINISSSKKINTSNIEELESFNSVSSYHGITTDIKCSNIEPNSKTIVSSSYISNNRSSIDLYNSSAPDFIYSTCKSYSSYGFVETLPESKKDSIYCTIKNENKKKKVFDDILNEDKKNRSREQQSGQDKFQSDTNEELFSYKYCKYNHYSSFSPDSNSDRYSRDNSTERMQRSNMSNENRYCQTRVNKNANIESNKIHKIRSNNLSESLSIKASVKRDRTFGWLRSISSSTVGSSAKSSCISLKSRKSKNPAKKNEERSKLKILLKSARIKKNSIDTEPILVKNSNRNIHKNNIYPESRCSFQIIQQTENEFSNQNSKIFETQNFSPERTTKEYTKEFVEFDNLPSNNYLQTHKYVNESFFSNDLDNLGITQHNISREYLDLKLPYRSEAVSTFKNNFCYNEDLLSDESLSSCQCSVLTSKEMEKSIINLRRETIKNKMIDAKNSLHKSSNYNGDNTQLTGTKKIQVNEGLNLEVKPKPTTNHNISFAESSKKTVNILFNEKVPSYLKEKSIYFSSQGEELTDESDISTSNYNSYAIPQTKEYTKLYKILHSRCHRSKDMTKPLSSENKSGKRYLKRIRSHQLYQSCLSDTSAFKKTIIVVNKSKNKSYKKKRVKHELYSTKPKRSTYKNLSMCSIYNPSLIEIKSSNITPSQLLQQIMNKKNKLRPDMFPDFRNLGPRIYDALATQDNKQLNNLLPPVLQDIMPFIAAPDYIQALLLDREAINNDKYFSYIIEDHIKNSTVQYI